MTTPRLITNFKDYSDPDLNVKALQIVNGITQRPDYFPPPHPELDAASLTATEFKEALAIASLGSRADKIFKNQVRRQLVKELKFLADWVSSKAKNDRAVLVASCFDLVKDRETSQAMGKPQIYKLEPGLNCGELVVYIKKLKGAKCYCYQLATGDPFSPNTEWTSDFSTVSRHHFRNLVSGQLYWCRVMAMGTRSQVVYSEPVSRIVH